MHEWMVWAFLIIFCAPVYLYTAFVMTMAAIWIICQVLMLIQAICMYLWGWIAHIWNLLFKPNNFWE